MNKSEKILLYGTIGVIGLILWNKYGQQLLPGTTPGTTTPGTTTPGTTTPVDVQYIPGTDLPQTHIPGATTDPTTPTITPGVINYINGNLLDTNVNLLTDKNGYLIADSVKKYDDKTGIVTLTNNYVFDIKNGTLKNDQGGNLIQLYNLQNRNIDNHATFFPYPKKIVGYSLINNIFWYIENDTTPYSLADSYFQKYTLQSIFNTVTNETYFTNYKRYNALISNGFYVETAQLYRCMSQQIPGSLIVYHKIDNLNYDTNINWENVLYISTNYGASIRCVGAGVKSYNELLNNVLFDDKCYLDINKNTLYNPDGTVKSKNCFSYVGAKAFHNGTGTIKGSDYYAKDLADSEMINFMDKYENKYTPVYYNVFYE